MSIMLILHIVFLIFWSASLLYLSQLFVHEVMAQDKEEWRRSVLLQRTLYARVMTPSALLSVLAGIWLIFERGFEGGWLHVKLALVLAMVFFHAYCGKVMADLRKHRIQHRLGYYRALPLAPALLILAVVTLVVGKPF